MGVPGVFLSILRRAQPAFFLRPPPRLSRSPRAMLFLIHSRNRSPPLLPPFCFFSEKSPFLHVRRVAVRDVMLVSTQLSKLFSLRAPSFHLYGLPLDRVDLSLSRFCERRRFDPLRGSCTFLFFYFRPPSFPPFYAPPFAKLPKLTLLNPPSFTASS